MGSAERFLLEFCFVCTASTDLIRSGMNQTMVEASGFDRSAE
jgi:hypothetical protein